jgi:hypothetical protein
MRKERLNDKKRELNVGKAKEKKKWRDICSKEEWERKYLTREMIERSKKM